MVLGIVQPTGAIVRLMDELSSSETPSERWQFRSWALLVGPAMLVPMAIWASNVGRNVAVGQLVVAGLLTFALSVLGVEVGGGPSVGRLVAAQTAALVFWSWQSVPTVWFQSDVMDTSVGFLAVAIAAWLASHLKSFDWLPRFLGASLGVAALSMAVTGVAGDWVGKAVPDPTPPSQLADAKAGRDLVFLIVDAHASPAILASDFDYDMTPTLAQLEEHGFAVAHRAFSNYSMTHFSVPSMLSLDYLFEPGASESAAVAAMSKRVIAGDAGLMDWLGEAGYTVTKFESGWEDDACGQVSRCYEAGWRSDVTNWLIASRTPFRRAWSSHPYPVRALEVLGDLPGVVRDAAGNGRPDFIMAHVLSPHAPLFLTAGCEDNYVEGLSGVNVGSPAMSPKVASARAAAYIDQVVCVGSHLNALAEALEGTNTVVLVAGDHGSDFDGQTFFPLRDWTERQLEERFSIFAAVRSPGDCGLVPDTLVNLGRYAVGCALGVSIPYLPDRFLGSGGGNAPLVDVTERVSRIRDGVVP